MIKGFTNTRFYLLIPTLNPEPGLFVASRFMAVTWEHKDARFKTNIPVDVISFSQGLWRHENKVGRAGGPVVIVVRSCYPRDLSSKPTFSVLLALQKDENK